MSESDNPVKSDISFTEYLEFEYLEVGDFHVDTQKAEIKVTVYNLIILEKHPKYATIKDSDAHIILFNNLSKYQRRIAKYKDGDSLSSEFEAAEIFADEFPTVSVNEPKMYYLGGVLREPCAWIGWDIEAASHEIRLPD